MSESEKKRRLEYRRKRRKIILLQLIIAIVIGLAIVVSSVVYFRINENYNLSYTETSAIDYKVYLKPNNEYEEEFLGKDQSYIASIIDHVDIDFDYQIVLDTEWANYSASYNVEATLIIRDNSSKKEIFSHTYPMKTETSFTSFGSKQLSLNEQITVGYDQYNDFAEHFNQVYNLTDVSCYLDVAMHVNTTGECEEFENADFGSCAFSLNIPLTKKTIEINMLSSIPQGKVGLITCENCVNKNLFKDLAFIAGGLEIVILAVLLVYTYTTRNHDINYEIKIKRLVSAYKSYIQKILNEFCYEGYHVLKVETFNEMLDIRDTINSPILMSENLDKTCTKFLIPTDNGILYVHEIKVEDYDEIYSNTNGVQEYSDSTVVTQVNAVEEVVATEETAVVEQAHHYRNGVKYDYSFLAKLHLSNEDTREFYQEIATFIQSYGLKVTRSWNKERVQFGRKTYAILSFKGLKLAVSFALNPADYEETKYKLADVSSVKKFAQTPAQMKVTSLRKVAWVKELFNAMLSADGVQNQGLVVEIPKVRAKTKNRLIKEELIKVEE